VAADQQVLQHGGVLEQLDVLEGARDAERGHRVRRLGGQITPVVGDAAAGGGIDAADQVEDRRLARAVGPDQREHLAAPDFEAHLVDREHAPEAHAQVLGRQEDVVAHLSRSDFWNDFCRLNMPLR
jgi:hypothetical protein